MQTERFDRLRKGILSEIFQPDNIVNVWRNKVKTQLRRSEIKDLYDNYDLNYNIKNRSRAISDNILNSNYRVSQPLIYRLEKKLGISRHMVIPQPMDALILQVLIEHLEKRVLRKQPSPNAFYTSTKGSVPKFFDFDNYQLAWRSQWKRHQELIFRFAEGKDHLVVTDLTNYFDSIDIRELRKVFSEHAQTEEVVLDLLFMIVEGISWVPDYLPYSWRGLPVANIDGIRLLAHSFLFEFDQVLNENANGNFARWMDDITFGFDERTDAINTLTALSDMLKSRGLALNLTKTDIYDKKDAFFHFQIEKNYFLRRFENAIDSDPNSSDELIEIINSKFNEHLKGDRKAKYWEHVSRRFIAAYNRLKSPLLLDQVTDLYVSFPGLRQALVRHLAVLGYGRKTSARVLEILGKVDLMDDTSIFRLCYLVTEWKIPDDSEGNDFIKKFGNKITKIYFDNREPFRFYSIIWFMAKYERPRKMLRFILQYENLWKTNSFLRRQVTAVLSRLYSVDTEQVRKLLQNQISSGIPDTVSVANQILFFKTLEKLDYLLNPYFFRPNGTPYDPYPLPKFLVLCSVLNSPNIRDNAVVKQKVKDHIDDPFYIKWLENDYELD